MLPCSPLAPLLPALLAAAQSGPPRYEVIDLGASLWGTASGMDVNEWRAVAGELDVGTSIGSGRHAVLWNPDGSLIDLTPEANISLASARALNNAGVVVGDLTTTDSAPEGGFRWRAGTLELLPSVFQQQAWNVDEGGTIAGHAHTPSFHIEPTLWAPDLAYAQLGTLGGVEGHARDRNGWGDVVGWSQITPSGTRPHAFLWRAGNMRDLGALPGHAQSGAFAIDVHGLVVGESGPYLHERAALWKPSGELVDLGDLGFAPRAHAEDINDHGTIVGWSYRADGRVAVAWMNGRIHDLNALIDPALGWRLESAEGINERGDIVGSGRLGAGALHAYLALRADGGNLAVIGPLPGRAGGRSTIHLVGATPGAPLALHVALRKGRAPSGACGRPLELERPRILYAVADAAGHASLDVTLPAGSSGKRLLLQGLEAGTCRRSSLVVSTIE